MSVLDQAQRQADDGKWSELPPGTDPRRPTEQEGGWVGPTAGLDAIQNTKFTVLSRNEPRIRGLPVSILVYIVTELSRLVRRSGDTSSFNFTRHDILQLRKSILQDQCERN